MAEKNLEKEIANLKKQIDEIMKEKGTRRVIEREVWEVVIQNWEEGRIPSPPGGEVPPHVMMAYGIRRILQEIQKK